MRYLAVILWLMVLSGCRTFEIGFVETPTADRLAATPTASATLPATAMREPSTVAPTTTATATITPTTTRLPTRRPTTNPIRPLPTPTLESPRIISFTVEPRKVDPGDTVTLRWSVANAGSINIYQHVPDTPPSYNTLNLSATGQITQTIRNGQRLWQAFELAAANAAGIITQTIAISIRCPYMYFFSPLPVEDRAEWSCPDGEPITSSAAEQVFEHGRMIWLQQDTHVYVFFDDGTYQALDDTWVAGQPDSVPGLTAPEGRTLPVRGFGKVWSGDETIRARLGWALAAEQGFDLLMQGGWIHCCSRLDAVSRPIYWRNHEGRVIRLWAGEMPPGQWRFVAP